VEGICAEKNPEAGPVAFSAVLLPFLKLGILSAIKIACCKAPFTELQNRPATAYDLKDAQH